MNECEIFDTDGVVRGTCDVDDLLGLLAKSHRRDVVSTLEAYERDWIVVDDLVESVSTMSTERSRSEVHVALHHAHLPVLDEAELIEYDEHGNTIRYHRCALIEHVLTAVEPDRTPTEC
jgi:hypothetical protein